MSKPRTLLVRLGYLVSIQSGITVDGNRGDGPDSVTRPYLRVANVQDGHLDLGTITEIRVPYSLARSATLKGGDVLMTEGGDLDKLGRGTVWNDEIENCLHQNHVFAVRPDLSKLLPEYLALITQSSYARAYFESTGTKTTNLASTSSSKIRDFRIPLVDLNEQRRIADFLDAETARIDSLIERKQAVISLLDERIQAIINEVTPGAVVLGTDGRPVGIKGRNCVRLGAIATVHGGFTMDEGREVGPDGVTMPYLRVANVLDGSLALEDIKEVTLPRVMADRCTLRSGDVLMTEGGDPDKLGRGTVWPGDFGPCLHQNAIFAVRPDSRLLPEYLALVTRTRYARAYFEVTASKSTGIAHTSSTKITGFHVPLPTIDEQRRLTGAVSEAVAKINALRQPSQRQLALLVERRQALITAAVTGGITV